MNINFTDLSKIGMGMLEIILRYVIPIGSFVISVIALKHSNDTVNVKVEVTELRKMIEELDFQIKQNQLEKIREEQNRVKRAKIEARIIKISSGKYRLKVWNSGDAGAYNVNVMIPEKYQIIIYNETMPFERLNVNKSFEEIVIIHSQSARKFKMILTWEDKDGNKYNDEIIETY